MEKIAGELESYDAGLIRVTGLSLRQIACAAAGITEQDLMERAGRWQLCLLQQERALFPASLTL